MSSDSPNAPAILAMLKAPCAGFVKTRLAQQVGDAPAAAIYRRLVEHQMGSLPENWRVEIHFAPDDSEAEMRAWLGPTRAYFGQQGDDLGSRLIQATSGAFDRAAQEVIVIGGDCPDLNAEIFRSAANALQSSDVVLGPALDGGYYLIGMRRSMPALFHDIPWSSGDVLRTTLDRVRSVGLSYFLLPAKEDVDDLASWRRLEMFLPPDPKAVVVSGVSAVRWRRIN